MLVMHGAQPLDDHHPTNILRPKVITTLHVRAKLNDDHNVERGEKKEKHLQHSLPYSIPPAP